MGVVERSVLEARQYRTCDSYGYYYGNNGCYYSGWSAYGRWILLGAIILAAFFIFLLFSCLTARRRRKQGRQPYPLTGWAGRNNHGQPQYNNNYSQGPPPAYGQPQGNAPQQGYYGNDGANQGYFGGEQQQPIQPPNQSYQGQGGSNVYAPPSGPPPGTKGHVAS